VSLHVVSETPLQPSLHGSAEWGPEEMVRRILGGDAGAEAELVRRFRRGVSVVLQRSGAESPAADDLSQEAFALALRKIRAGEVRQPERLAGFLCSLARNLAIEHFRRVGARRSAGPPDENLPSAAASPLEELLQTERAATVRKVLAELPSDRDRQVLFRFYLAEEDKDVICKDLGLTSLHFNRVVFRARERYREMYLSRTESPGGPR
jgi:RNA polymerase sigma-70 factor, ECF subfamily